MRQFWREYSLGLVLLVLFLSSWVGQGVAQWQEFRQEAESHEQAVEVTNFLWVFASRTLENWESEFLQLASFVVLSRFLVFKESPQSRDGDDRLEAKIDELRSHFGLDKLE